MVQSVICVVEAGYFCRYQEGIFNREVQFIDDTSVEGHQAHFPQSFCDGIAYDNPFQIQGPVSGLYGLAEDFRIFDEDFQSFLMDELYVFRGEVGSFVWISIGKDGKGGVGLGGFQRFLCGAECLYSKSFFFQYLQQVAAGFIVMYNENLFLTGKK